MITFYNSKDEPTGTLELVDGVLKATGRAASIVGPPEHRPASDEAVYAYYSAWSNGYSYAKEDSTDSE